MNLFTNEKVPTGTVPLQMILGNLEKLWGSIEEEKV